MTFQECILLEKEDDESSSNDLEDLFKFNKSCLKEGYFKTFQKSIELEKEDEESCLVDQKIIENQIDSITVLAVTKDLSSNFIEETLISEVSDVKCYPSTKNVNKIENHLDSCSVNKQILKSNFESESITSSILTLDIKIDKGEVLSTPEESDYTTKKVGCKKVTVTKIAVTPESGRVEPIFYQEIEHLQEEFNSKIMSTKLPTSDIKIDKIESLSTLDAIYYTNFKEKSDKLKDSIVASRKKSGRAKHKFHLLYGHLLRDFQSNSNAITGKRRFDKIKDSIINSMKGSIGVKHKVNLVSRNLQKAFQSKI